MRLRYGKDYNDKSVYTEIENKHNFLQSSFPQDSRSKVSLSVFNHKKTQSYIHKNIRKVEELSHKHVKTYSDEFKHFRIQKSVETFSLNQITNISEGFSNFIDCNEDKRVFTSTPLHKKFNLTNRISRLSLKSDIASEHCNYGYFQALNFKTKNKSEESSLEDYVFHDISPTKVSSLNETEKLNSENASHKYGGFMTYGNKLLKENCDIDFNHSFNHVQRSYFRQRRREWYLNRNQNVYNKYTSHFYVFYKWQYIFFKLLIRTLIQIYNTFNVNVQSNVSRTSLYFNSISKNLKNSCFHNTSFASYMWRSIFQVLSYINVTYYMQLLKSFVKETISNIFFSTSKTDSSEKKTVDSFIISKYFNQAFLGLVVFLCVVVISHITLLGYNRSSLPDLTENGISNAFPFFMDEKEQIPAWRVVNSKNLSAPLKSPFILFLHSGRSQQFHKLKELFQVLSSLGYILIIPKHQLYWNEVSYTWNSIKTNYPNSTAYLWGDNLDSSLLSAYAQDFCSDSYPVSGVVISTEDVISWDEKLKIWSCNCTIVNSDGIYHKYNNVYCPLGRKQHESFYESIIVCLQALHLK